MVADRRVVGPYVLGPVIGRGANGIVYEATDEKLRRKVALKVLAQDVHRTKEQRLRFTRKARLLAAVRPPNVAVVYGVVEEGDEVWLALEFLEGQTLFDALERDPDPSVLPPNTPARVRELLERCLQKDPKKRLRDAGDAQLELETALRERSWTRSVVNASEDERGRAGRGPWSYIAIAVAAAAGLGWWLGGRPSDDRRVAMPELRLVLDVPAGEKQTFPRLSPDGETLIHEIAPKRGPEGRHLVQRRPGSFEDLAIPGTERVEGFAFSPDGAHLAVVRLSEGASGRELVLVGLDGEEPPLFVDYLPKHEVGSNPVWLQDGRIVLGTRPRGLLLVKTDGSGQMEEIAVVCNDKEWPGAPQVLDELPGTGRVLASSFHMSGRRAVDALVAIDLESGLQTLILDESSHADWQPSGQLLFSRADVLFSAPIHLDTLVLGAAEPVADDLFTPTGSGSGLFHASRGGSIVYWPGGLFGAERSLWFVDGQETPQRWSDDALPIVSFLEANAGGTFVMMGVVGPAGNYELWGSEVDRPNLRQLLADPGVDYRGAYALTSGRELITCSVAQQGDELRRTSLDDPDEGELIYRDNSGSNLLGALRFFEQEQLLAVWEYGPEQARILTFDLSREGPYEPRVLFEGPLGWRIDLSSDLGWLLTANSEVGMIIRAIGAGGKFGPPISVPTPGFEVVSSAWAPPSDEDRQRLFFWV